MPDLKNMTEEKKRLPRGIFASVGFIVFLLFHAALANPLINVTTLGLIGTVPWRGPPLFRPRPVLVATTGGGRGRPGDLNPLLHVH
jgi:hypothetical protein